jgi:hypothetical protein
MTTTTAPVDWDSPTWGRNPVHVSTYVPDAHDESEARACR